MFLSKEELINLTGLKQAPAMINWLDANPKPLIKHNLIWAGCINNCGLPIVEKIQLKNRMEGMEVQQWLINKTIEIKSTNLDEWGRGYIASIQDLNKCLYENIQENQSKESQTNP